MTCLDSVHLLEDVLGRDLAMYVLRPFFMPKQHVRYNDFPCHEYIEEVFYKDGDFKTQGICKHFGSDFNGYFLWARDKKIDGISMRYRRFDETGQIQMEELTLPHGGQRVRSWDEDGNVRTIEWYDKHGRCYKYVEHE